MSSGAQGSIPRRARCPSASSAPSPGAKAYAQEIESAFGIDACDIYGLSEVMGPGVAQEFAQTKEGPTIWEDHFLPEIVDPETGEVLADGEPGELVFTSLTKEAHAGDSLPDARSHASAARKRHRHAPLREDHAAAAMTC